jgi:ribonuclease HI
MAAAGPRHPGPPGEVSPVEQLNLLGRPGPVVAYIDGGARGNPGPAGYGVRIETPDGRLLDELSGALGVTTNNVAEYQGLLAALRWAAVHDHRDVRIRSDSELLVKQMRGEYRVKSAGLQPLHEEARALVRRLGRVAFEHVPRSRNREADRLANRAMDDAAGQT